MYYSINTIKSVCNHSHNQQKIIVLVTGFFDLLHAEHINFLQKARAAGDILIVAVESDERARLLKGEGRPVESQTIRLKHLVSYADYLIALDPSFNNPIAYESLIAAVKPDLLAVSSHTAHQDKKSVLVAKYGGKLAVVHAHNPNISTTTLISKL